MKAPQDVVAVLDRRLGAVWAAHAAGQPVPWAPRIPLGSVTGADLQRDFPAYATWARTWRAWADERGLILDERVRRVHGTDQPLPTGVLVPDVPTAAAVVGGSWPDLLRAGAARAAQLRDRFPHLDSGTQLPGLVKAVAEWSELDVELLCAAGLWFASHDGTGLTPRQVPIPGMHAKWLNTRQHLVCALAGRDELGLVRAHPARVHFTYLDPDHLAAGGRRHDSHSVGDTVPLPYPVRVVLICENKDSVVTFPPVPGAVAVEGNGSGAGAIADLPWLRSAPVVVYWGDMDPEGLEILAQFREGGLAVRSMLMDVPAYTAWSRFGTWHDRSGAPLRGRDARQLPALDLHERELYGLLCDPAFTGPRRVEQERVPLPVAHQVLLALLDA